MLLYRLKWGIFTDGLQGHWSVDTDHQFYNDWRISDLSGNGHAGILCIENNLVHDFPWRTVGNFLKLSQNQWINLGQLSFPYVTLEITITANNNPSGNEIDFLSNLQGGGYAIFYTPDYGMNCYAHINGSYHFTNNEIFSYINGNTYYLTMTYDGQQLKFYRDGVLIGTNNIKGTITQPYQHTILAINCNPYGGGFPSDSLGTSTFKFHCARIYNRALTDAEVLHNYQVDHTLFGN